MDNSFRDAGIGGRHAPIKTLQAICPVHFADALPSTQPTFTSVSREMKEHMQLKKKINNCDTLPDTKQYTVEVRVLRKHACLANRANVV